MTQSATSVCVKVVTQSMSLLTGHYHMFYEWKCRIFNGDNDNSSIIMTKKNVMFFLYCYDSFALLLV